MRVGILGGGFGLYGYLPALVQMPGLTVILPVRYQKYFETRSDIGCFYDIVEWVSDEEELLKTCDGVVVALPPEQQYMWVKKCLNCTNISHILLEKPLAVNPVIADNLLNSLKSSGKKFRIGYNFRYTEWGLNILKGAETIESMSWDFCANHYYQNIQTWKRQHKYGGGALNFYGIHIVAFLAELGYKYALYSEITTKYEGEADSWSAELGGINLSSCKIKVDSNNTNTNFIIHYNKEEVLSLLQPFQTIEQPKSAVIDIRIPVLKRLLLDLFYNDQFCYNLYDEVNLLWENIAQKTIHNIY